ncbi:uncharacterized protein IWZ02DRAFT_491926 [Phyllosticta citriasiana]|uniref:Uncharacterized protein n=1 Tax=Phyllosticta citriasiana TaxID=595635 RepID=A0ABR1KZ00_9PEZI
MSSPKSSVAPADAPPIKQEIKEEEVEDTSFTAINKPDRKDSKDLTASAKRPAPEVDESVATPAKRTKGRLTPEGADMDPGARQRKKPPKKAVSTPKAIGTTVDELDPVDRKMIQMKDSGYGWKDIGKMWTEATGEVTAKSTLPNRYARIKANIMTMPEDEQRKLAEAIVWVEEDFEKTKWERISQRMQEQGVETKYAIGILQKQYQKMQAAAAATADGDKSGSTESPE